MSNQDPYSGGWSDWMPHSDQSRYYRARQDESGVYHYEYAAFPAVDPAVPRGEDTGLETAFGNVSLTDPYSQYNYSQPYDQGSYGYAATQDGTGGAGFASASGGQAQHYGIPPPQGHSSSSRKGKGLDTGATKSKKGSRAPGNKEQERKSSSSKKQQGPPKHKIDGLDYQHDDSLPPNVPFYSRDALPTHYSTQETANLDGAAFDVGDQYQGTDYHDGSSDPAYMPTGTDYPAEEYPAEEYPAEEHPQEPEKSGHRSRHQSKGKQTKPSRSGKHKQSSSTHPEDSEEEAFNAAVENSDPYNPGAGGYPDEEDAGNLTPRAGSPHGDPSLYETLPSSRPYFPSDSGGQYTTNAYPPHVQTDEAIQGDNGDSYDDRYVIEPSSRFEPGEVFKILWSEPKGRRDGVSEEEISHEEYEVMGQKFYTNYRRFVIVANDFGHCTCVPVLTYERRACNKKGVKPEKHGVVYPVYGRPQLLPNEPKLGFEPVRLELDYQTEKLAKESRINYSKLVTVEHNVSVFFIGRIVEDDFDVVRNAVDKCWAEKLRAAGGGGGGGGGSGGGDSSRHRRRHKR